LPTREKEVIVYHRRSVEEREAAKERNRIAMMEQEVAALEDLEQEVTAGLILCRIKKKLQSFAKKLKKNIHGKSSKN
jgi:hypothetical protein